MSYIVAAIIGALIGWIASMIMGTDHEQGAIANILIGIVGAALGRWLFVDVLGWGGAATAGTFTLGGILWGVAGAVILIAILKALNLMGKGSNA